MVIQKSITPRSINLCPKFTRETRVGTKQMGTRMVKLAIELYDSPWINWYHQQMKDKRAKLHPAICFTMLGHYLGVDIETIIDYYLYQNVSSLTQMQYVQFP